MLKLFSRTHANPATQLTEIFEGYELPPSRRSTWRPCNSFVTKARRRRSFRTCLPPTLV